MKFGFKVPSLKKRLSARLSTKRYIRHNLGFKMPRGTGMLSNPEKALYNKVYRQTTFGIDDIFDNKQKQVNANTKKTSNNSGIGLLIVLNIILFIINPIIGTFLFIISGICYYYWLKKPKQQVKIKLKKAKNLFDKQNYEEAIKTLNEAKDLDSKNSDVTYLLGASYHNFEQYKKAVEPLRKITIQFPDNMYVQMLLSNCYYKTGQYTEAISILQKIPENSEQYLEIIKLLGACFHSQKKYDLAIEVFKKAPLQKRKLDNDLLEIHYNIALIYEESEDKKSALKHFKKVYAHDIQYRNVTEKIEALES